MVKRWSEHVAARIGTVRPPDGHRRRTRTVGVRVVVAILAPVFLVAGVLAPGTAGATQMIFYAAPAALGAGDCTTAAAACTLATALSDVGPGGTIELTSVGPYIGGFTLSTSGTTSSTPVTIQPAGGVSNPVLSGGNTLLVLNITSAAYVSITGITVENGTHTASGAGGIDDNAGATLTITGSTFLDNHGNNGGAIALGTAGTGTVSVASSTFTGNTANWGGAVNVGAGPGDSGTLNVSGSTFANDSSNSYAGGAIASGDFGGSGNVTIVSSSFTGDHAGAEGGAIDNGYYSTDGTVGHATLVVSGSTFSGNSSGGPGGAIANAGANSGKGTATVSTSTFSGNFANIGGGAIENAFGNGSVGILSVTASTFAGDTANNGGSPAIVNEGGNPAGSATTTLAGDVFAEACNQSRGTLNDGGYNVGTNGSCLHTGTGDNVDAGLQALVAPLANDGGPTQAMALLAGNPAIGIIPNGTSGLCPVTDQRGVTSSAGSVCDAGAVQLVVATQTVSFTSTAPTTVLVGGPSYTPAATASTGLLVGISLDGSSSGCTLSGGIVTFVISGTCVIDAVQAGNSSYAAAQVQQTFPVVGLPAISLTLGGLPLGSSTGNTFTATLDVPAGDPAPTGAVTVTDSGGGSCASSSWADAGPDGGVGENYTTTCQIYNPELAGQTASAALGQSNYAVSSSTPLTVGAAPAAISLALSGTPVASVSGNAYTVTLDVPMADPAPVGNVTVTDSGGGSCIPDTSDNGWNDAGPDGTGGENYTAACQISSAELAGQTVTAAYDQSDYTIAPSNSLTVGGGVTVTVNFQANGGGGTMSAESESYGTATALTANTFTFTGHTFTGWNTAAGGSGVAYSNSASFPFTTGATLYAQWAAVTVTVNFQANGGGGTMSAESESYGTAAALTANTFTFTGHTFTGWNTAAGGSGVAYSNSASFPFTLGVALYAQWALIPAPPSYPTPPVTVGPVTLIQAGPTSATVADGAGYIGQLLVMNAVGGDHYTEPMSVDAFDVVVSGSGAISASTSLSPGTYPVSGTDMDTNGDPGTWAFSLTVAQATQSISFTAPATGTVEGAASLSATASSSLVVTVSVDSTSSNDACAISGSTVSYLHAGRCVIDANQAGDATYLAAAQVSQTITIAKAATKTALTLSVTKVSYQHEQLEHLSVSVTWNASGVGPTGTVTIREGSSAKTLCVVNLSSGKGSCTLSPRALRVGTYHLFASYGATSGFRASSSANYALNVTR